MNFDGNLPEGLHATLGMEFIPDGKGLYAGRIKIDGRHVQHMGFANGGVFLSLSETVAGLASMTVCPDSRCLGVSVCGNHLHSAKVGDMITARARIVHLGAHIHVWDVEITNQDGLLVHKGTVTNSISDDGPKQ